MRRWAVSFLLSCLAACGGGRTESDSSVSGSVSGQPVSIISNERQALSPCSDRETLVRLGARFAGVVGRAGTGNFVAGACHLSRATRMSCHLEMFADATQRHA